MIKSMTGYGKGEALLEQKKITVEIRTLNSKQLDISLKVPSIYRHVENELRNSLGKELGRGKVDVYVNYEYPGEASSTTINRDLFSSYFQQISQLSKDSGVEWGYEVASAIIPTILRMPDVVGVERNEVTTQETQALLHAAAVAVRHLELFRKQEGEVLMAELLGRVSTIEMLLVEVEPYENARIENVRRRIRENIETMAIPFDSNRLEQELIYYIEKLDVTEEKVRLSNHCKYFREISAEEQDNGRKLGFIAQEMGREINTLGSKANDGGMQRIVVQMKDELEKIKEQTLNVL